MAKSIFWSKKFKQDYSRLIKSGNSVAVNGLLKVIEMLANNKPLPKKYQDHALKGTGMVTENVMSSLIFC